MTVMDRSFPFDAGAGANSTEGYWREMARNFSRLLTAGPDAAPILDVLDKAMRDKAAEVRNSAKYALVSYGLRDFAPDFPEYEAWYKANRPKTIRQVLTDSAKWFAAHKSFQPFDAECELTQSQ